MEKFNLRSFVATAKFPSDWRRYVINTIVQYKILIFLFMDIRAQRFKHIKYCNERLIRYVLSESGVDIGVTNDNKYT